MGLLNADGRLSAIWTCFEAAIRPVALVDRRRCESTPGGVETREACTSTPAGVTTHLPRGLGPIIPELGIDLHPRERFVAHLMPIAVTVRSRR